MIRSPTEPVTPLPNEGVRSDRAFKRTRDSAPRWWWASKCQRIMALVERCSPHGELDAYVLLASSIVKSISVYFRVRTQGSIRGMCLLVHFVIVAIRTCTSAAKRSETESSRLASTSEDHSLACSRSLAAFSICLISPRSPYGIDMGTTLPGSKRAVRCKSKALLAAFGSIRPLHGRAAEGGVGDQNLGKEQRNLGSLIGRM